MRFALLLASAPLLAAPLSVLPGATPDVAFAAVGPTAQGSLSRLVVKGRAPRTGYTRAVFGAAWADIDRNGCDTRNDVLKRDLTGETFRAGTRSCVVVTGLLRDPYTARPISFTKAAAAAVQIDHVVALSDAWQKGARTWSPAKRLVFANDPLNLLAVDGPTNQRKGDGDAATWLPPNRAYRCSYVARQVAVKVRYGAWVTPAERAAMARVLATCPTSLLPRGGAALPAPIATAPAPVAPAPVAPAPVAPVPVAPVPVAPGPVAPAPTPTVAAAPSAPANPGNTRNCGDFASWSEADAWYQTYVGAYGDVAQLDADHDGVVCESLPGAP